MNFKEQWQPEDLITKMKNLPITWKNMFDNISIFCISNPAKVNIFLTEGEKMCRKYFFTERHIISILQDKFIGDQKVIQEKLYFEYEVYCNVIFSC